MSKWKDQFSKLSKSFSSSTHHKYQKIGRFLKKYLFVFKILTQIGIAVVIIAIFIVNIISEIQAYGPTPHYYVDKNASSGIKSQEVYKQYANLGSDNSTAAAAAVALATMDMSDGNYKQPIPYSSGSIDLVPYIGDFPYTPETYHSVIPQLIEVAEQSTLISKWYKTDMWASCDLSVAAAYWWSGVDIYFPACLGELDSNIFGPNGKPPDGGQVQYLYGRHSTVDPNDPIGMWEEVPRGEDVLPGDIGISIDPSTGFFGHIWMYVATWTKDGGWIDNSIVREKYPNSTANRYEGSSEKYYARLIHESIPWNEDTYTIFRYTGPKHDEKDLYKRFTEIKE